MPAPLLLCPHPTYSHAVCVSVCCMCVAECCRVWQRGEVCCSVTCQTLTHLLSCLHPICPHAVCDSMLQVWCSVLQLCVLQVCCRYVAVYCRCVAASLFVCLPLCCHALIRHACLQSVLLQVCCRCVAVCCSVMQCVAVCCSVL